MTEDARLGLWAPVIKLPNVSMHTHLLPRRPISVLGWLTDLEEGMDQHSTDVFVLDSDNHAVCLHAHKIRSEALFILIVDFFDPSAFRESKSIAKLKNQQKCY